MRVRSLWSGPGAPTEAVRPEALQFAAVPPIVGARSLEAEQSFEEGES
jgi:hypothetical protein